jgi:hypothetical protein
VIKLLRQEGLLGGKRVELLLSWQHTGFSVRGETRLGPTDREAIETAAAIWCAAP